MKETVGVVGAGLMGTEIAFVYALAGHDVRLADRCSENVSIALNRLGELVGKGLKRGFYEPAAAEAALRRIAPSKAEDFGDRNFVTEAVFEDIEVKAAVLETLSRVCLSDCLIAPNT